MSGSNDLLLSYYGDDFTGSTDVMEALTRAGLRTVMFIAPPTAEQLRKYEGLRAVGLAGASRTMSPERMDVELAASLEKLAALHTPIVHYKMCSTFDSSPQVGSIGRAIDIGMRVFGEKGSRVTPLLVGAPILGRYCAFGNLFARSGLDTEPCRLDRHPTMRHHPTTPMDESDLRVHLGKQTARKIGLFDVLALALPPEEADARFASLLEAGHSIILFDVLYDEHLLTIGRLIWNQVNRDKSLFVVGSSGVEYAMTAHMKSRGLLPAPRPLGAEAAEKLVVVSGSCSPVTDRQIGWLLERGARAIPLKTERLVDPQHRQEEIESSVRQALGILAGGHSVVLPSCRGPEDPRLAATVKRLEAMGQDAKLRSAEIIGCALGDILLRILERSSSDGKLLRSAVTGGDTSTFVAKTMGIEALEMLAPLAPGAPLCTTHAPGTPVHGLEIVFKGGQNGKTDFFGTLMNPGRT
jgi:uncharacterized protein YgbK (DUF1537 family)